MCGEPEATFPPLCCFRVNSVLQVQASFQEHLLSTKYPIIQWVLAQKGRDVTRDQDREYLGIMEAGVDTLLTDEEQRQERDGFLPLTRVSASVCRHNILVLQKLRKPCP